MANELSLEEHIQDLLDELYIPVFNREGASLDVRDRLEVFRRYYGVLAKLREKISESKRSEAPRGRGVDYSMLSIWAGMMEDSGYKGYYLLEWLRKLSVTLKGVEAFEADMWGHVL